MKLTTMNDVLVFARAQAERSVDIGETCDSGRLNVVDTVVEHGHGVATLKVAMATYVQAYWVEHARQAHIKAEDQMRGDCASVVLAMEKNHAVPILKLGRKRLLEIAPRLATFGVRVTQHGDGQVEVHHTDAVGYMV